MGYQAGGYKVAIVGATGNVGREMLEIGRASCRERV